MFIHLDDGVGDRPVSILLRDGLAVHDWIIANAEECRLVLRELRLLARAEDEVRLPFTI